MKNKNTFYDFNDRCTKDYLNGYSNPCSGIVLPGSRYEVIFEDLYDKALLSGNIEVTSNNPVQDNLDERLLLM